jgi:predicted ABC-class ATPase
LLNQTWYKADPSDGYRAEVKRLTDKLFLQKLIDLASNQEVTPQARATALFKLSQLKNKLSATGTNPKTLAHRMFGADQIRRAEGNIADLKPTTPQTPPEGAPIDPGQEWLSPDCDWN